MNYNFKNLESRLLANEFDTMLDFINDALDHFKEQKYSLKETKDIFGFGEFGFYIKSRQEIKTIFIGTWMDAWRETGNPISVVLDWTNTAKNDLYFKDIEIFVKENRLKYSIIEGYPVINYPFSFFERKNVFTDLEMEIKKIGKLIQFIF